MPQQLPDNWTTLNVARDLRIRGSYPQDLRIKRHVRTQNLIAEFLPSVEDDTREHAGRSRNGKGKRLTLQASMGTPDPFEAAKRAISWVQNIQREAKEQKEQAEDQKNHSLWTYWERWFAREGMTRQSVRNFARWKRDESLKWDGEGYGIKHQPWSQKAADRITAADFTDYFALLDLRRTPTNDMSGTKKQQKTLIRKLLKEARSDFPHLVIPDFPEISTQKHQVRHLKREEWDRLLEKVVELSKGAARQNLSVSDYQDLEFSKANNQNQRNWVDLYDCLNLMWFFYLRAEDLPRIKAEWFQDKGEWISCLLEETKGNRIQQETTTYRPEAVENWRRMNQRRPTGFLVFPQIKRSEGEISSTLKRTWNSLLKSALDACEIPSKGMTMTNIRHTAFRLILEEVPDLGRQPDIHAFAANGNTSVEMLQETYLRFIEHESTAKKVRAKVKPGKWALTRRALD